MWKTNLRLVKVEDLYGSLTLSITFNDIKAYEDFKFDLIFDIQMTLDEEYRLNIYNRATIDDEYKIILLKSLPMDEALPTLEILIDDARFVATRICDATYLEKCIPQKIYEKEVDTFELDGSTIAKLRTMRERLLELLSYSS